MTEDLQRQIDELSNLIITEYDPPSGPEYSFPMPGIPIDQEQFRLISLGGGSGVLDLGGKPYHLKKWSTDAETNQKNSMRLTISETIPKAQAVISGYYHVLNEDMEISLPPVTTETTYHICLTFDPRVIDEMGEHAAGAISVQVYNTSPPNTFGRMHVELWRVTRRPNQLLTDATIQYIHPKITPVINVDSRAALPEPGSQLWGTRCLIRPTGEEVIAVGEGDTGPTRWDTIQPAKAAGRVTVTMRNSANGTANITFPTGMFESAPNLFLTKQGDGLAKTIPYASSVTTTGAVVGLYTGDGAPYNGSVVVAWRAIQY